MATESVKYINTYPTFLFDITDDLVEAINGFSQAENVPKLCMYQQSTQWLQKNILLLQSDITVIFTCSYSMKHHHRQSTDNTAEIINILHTVPSKITMQLKQQILLIARMQTCMCNKAVELLFQSCNVHLKSYIYTLFFGTSNNSNNLI